MLLAVGLVLLYTHQRGRDLVDAGIRARMMNIAEGVTVFVDPEVHKSFYQPELIDIEHPTWKAYAKTFQRLLAQQKDLTYLYTTIRRARYYFILNGTPEDDIENASELMEEYLDPA